MKHWYDFDDGFDDFSYRDWGNWWGGSRDKDIQRLARIRDELAEAVSQPFLSDIIYALKPVAMEVLPDGHPNESIATDGQIIAFNPGWLRKQSDADLKVILAHEAAHVALYHPLRFGDRHMLLANIAADYAVNPLLKETMTLPEGALYKKMFEGWSFEKIYDYLQEHKDDPKEGFGGKSLQELMDQYDQQTEASADPTGQGGIMRPTKDGKRLSDRELRELEAKQGTENAKARMSAKQAGNMPAGFERKIEDSQHQVLSWEDLLSRFVARGVKADYTWRRPNRRLLSQGFYLPQMKQEGVGELVVAIDTSGSIDAVTLGKFQKELNRILEACKPEKIHCISCDAQVHEHREFNSTEEVTMPTSGGGGTSFIPPFTLCQEKNIQPLALIYFTDLCCNSYPERPSYPVLWAATERGGEPPWGEVVMLKDM